MILRKRLILRIWWEDDLEIDLNVLMKAAIIVKVVTQDVRRSNRLENYTVGQMNCWVIAFLSC